MIIDSFLFFNELDLLEVRLNELSPYVDKFLLVEAHHTFQGEAKPLYYAENRERFAKFNDRIIHVVADLPQGDTYEHGWERERASRDAVAKGLEGLPGDAILLLSDLDEIPNLIGWDHDQEIPACWSHTLYYYYVDLEIGPIKGTVAVPLKMFLENPDIRGSGSKLREWRHYNPKFVLDGTRGGWHFSYLGGVDAIQAKIRAFAHAELNPHATKENIRKALEESWKNNVDLFNRSMYEFKHVQDGDLPSYLQKNRDKFSHFWMPDKLPLPCALRELPEQSPIEAMKQLVIEENLPIDVATWDDESPNVVDSGPVVLGMVHDAISDMVQGGYFEEKCEPLEEPPAPRPEEPGSSGSETTEQPSSSASHVETTYKMDPDQDLAKILDEAAKSLPSTGFMREVVGSQRPLSKDEQEVLKAYVQPAVEVIGSKIENDLLEKYQEFESEQQKTKLSASVAENDSTKSEPETIPVSVSPPYKKIRACSKCGSPVTLGDDGAAYGCSCNEGWSWTNETK